MAILVKSTGFMGTTEVVSVPDGTRLVASPHDGPDEYDIWTTIWRKPADDEPGIGEIVGSAPFAGYCEIVNEEG